MESRPNVSNQVRKVDKDPWPPLRTFFSPAPACFVPASVRPFPRLHPHPKHSHVAECWSGVFKLTIIQALTGSFVEMRPRSGTGIHTSGRADNRAKG